jgi:hypothetical protein
MRRVLEFRRELAIRPLVVASHESTLVQEQSGSRQARVMPGMPRGGGGGGGAGWLRRERRRRAKVWEGTRVVVVVAGAALEEGCGRRRRRGRRRAGRPGRRGIARRAH